LSSHLLYKNTKIKIYKTIILPVVAREEHTLRVFEKRMLRRMFGMKRDEVIGGWRKLHNEELYNLYGAPSIIRMTMSRRMRWAGNIARMGEGGGGECIQGFGEKARKKEPLGRPRCKREDNIKMDLRETDEVVWT
jgi:hypothetical protein